MKTAIEKYRQELAAIREAGTWKDERIITTPQQSRIDTTAAKQVVNMCANNYLGLSDHPALIEAAKASYDKWGFGLSSVRFICGTQAIHKELEKKLSEFLGMDDAILYSSCFDANGGLFETLLGPDDAVISDELNHASIIDGVRLCKAKRFRYKNNTMEDLRRCLEEAKAAADYLAGLETVDGGNLGVMGWSQGGTDALLAAEAHPDTFQAVVTWSGALELNGASLFAGTSFEDAYAQAKTEGFYTMTFDWREPLELGERWFQEVAETNILKVTADIKAPILAINGKDDTTVTPDNAEKIVKAAANADSQLLLVDNCDHTYNVFSGDFTALYQTVDATAAFFQAQLIPAAAQAAA